MLEFKDAVNVSTSKSDEQDMGLSVLFTGKSFPSTKTQGLALGVMFSSVVWAPRWGHP